MVLPKFLEGGEVGFNRVQVRAATLPGRSGIRKVDNVVCGNEKILWLAGVRSVAQGSRLTATPVMISYANTTLFPNVAERDIEIVITVILGPPAMLPQATEQCAWRQDERVQCGGKHFDYRQLRVDLSGLMQVVPAHHPKSTRRTKDAGDLHHRFVAERIPAAEYHMRGIVA